MEILNFGINAFFLVPLSQPWTGLFWPRAGKEENRVLGSVPDNNGASLAGSEYEGMFREKTIHDELEKGCGPNEGGRQLNGEDDMDQRSRRQRKCDRNGTKRGTIRAQRDQTRYHWRSYAAISKD